MNNSKRTTGIIIALIVLAVALVAAYKFLPGVANAIGSSGGKDSASFRPDGRGGNHNAEGNSDPNPNHKKGTARKGQQRDTAWDEAHPEWTGSKERTTPGQ